MEIKRERSRSPRNRNSSNFGTKPKTYFYVYWPNMEKRLENWDIGKVWPWERTKGDTGVLMQRIGPHSWLWPIIGDTIENIPRETSPEKAWKGEFYDVPKHIHLINHGFTKPLEHAEEARKLVSKFGIETINAGGRFFTSELTNVIDIETLVKKLWPDEFKSITEYWKQNNK